MSQGRYVRNRWGAQRCALLALTLLLTFGCESASGQSVPIFKYSDGGDSYTLVGRSPDAGGTTTIPTVVVPVSLVFESAKTPLDASVDVPALQRSPVFTEFAFPGVGTAQYADAMLRATFPQARSWHTILAKPEVGKAIRITVPAAFGYVLTSRKTGTRLAIADVEYVQRQLFKQVPAQHGKLVIAVTHNTAYYGEGDASICCSWGTHGSDAATANSFVLASYLSEAPPVVKEQDVQPLTEQLAEFINDPLHDPLVRQRKGDMPGNHVPAWLRPPEMRPGDQGKCGGTRIASAYFLLEPTDTNRKNNLPESIPFIAREGSEVYHVQNVALLPWYLRSSGGATKMYSFPDANALAGPAQPCPSRSLSEDQATESQAQAKPAPAEPTQNGHALIGYWTGAGRGGKALRLRDVSPQWDVIIVAFATPAKNAPEGTLEFRPPDGISPEELKSDMARLRGEGKKVLLSLGGGGEYFTMDHAGSIPVFVSCVSRMVQEYKFDGIDLDFETPSLMIAPGDTDFKHPSTPSIVNLIAGLRHLRNERGPAFMISLVPEGPQIPAGHLTYGGQFGSYLPIAYGIRDMLSFMDVQDYNTPPLQGLDGEIYQAGTVDYHAAVTELVLHGFHVGGQREAFPPLPQNKVAVGFLTGETKPDTVVEAMKYIITGSAPPSATYKLREPGGYPRMIGAMFWTIDDDERENYRFSNAVGPALHSFDARR